MPDLNQQIRQLIDEGCLPVTSEEVIDSANIARKGNMIRPFRYRPRRIAVIGVASFGIVAAVIVLTLVLTTEPVPSKTRPSVLGPETASTYAMLRRSLMPSPG